MTISIVCFNMVWCNENARDRHISLRESSLYRKAAAVEQGSGTVKTRNAILKRIVASSTLD
jgi:hypothetical protein